MINRINDLIMNTLGDLRFKCINKYKQTRLGFKYPDGTEVNTTQLFSVDSFKQGRFMIGLYNTFVDGPKIMNADYNLICLNQKMTKQELINVLQTSSTVQEITKDTEVFFNYMIVRNYDSAQNYKDALTNLNEYVPELGDKVDNVLGIHFSKEYECIYFNKETNVITFVTDSPDQSFCAVDKLTYMTMYYKGYLEDVFIKDLCLNLVMTTDPIDILHKEGFYYDRFTYRYRIPNNGAALVFMPPAIEWREDIATEIFGDRYEDLKDTIDTVYQCMKYVQEKLLAIPGIIDKINEQIFNEFDGILKDNQQAKLEQSIRNKKQRIESDEQSLRNQYRELADLEVQLLGYRTRDAQDTPANMFKDYFKTISKNVAVPVSLGDYYGNKTLKFKVSALCTAFNPELASKLLTNENLNGVYPIMQSIKDCFLTDNARVLFNTEFEFNSTNYFATDTRHVEDTMPNPHLGRYNCWGGNGAYIEKALAECNYIQAWQTMKDACSALNFGDNPVMSAFESYLKEAKEKDIKCIQTKDGKVLTINEFLGGQDEKDLSQSESDEGTTETTIAI